MLALSRVLIHDTMVYIALPTMMKTFARQLFPGNMHEGEASSQSSARKNEEKTGTAKIIVSENVWNLLRQSLDIKHNADTHV